MFVTVIMQLSIKVYGQHGIGNCMPTYRRLGLTIGQL